MGKSSPVRARARKFQKELFSHFMALILANTVVRDGVQVHQLLPSFGSQFEDILILLGKKGALLLELNPINRRLRFLSKVLFS